MKHLVQKTQNKVYLLRVDFGASFVCMITLELFIRVFILHRSGEEEELFSTTQELHIRFPVTSVITHYIHVRVAGNGFRISHEVPGTSAIFKRVASGLSQSCTSGL